MNTTRTESVYPSGCCAYARLLGKTFALLCLACFSGCAKVNHTDAPVRTIAAIRSLPERAIASGRRVELRGVVTVFDPGWRLLTIQDDTGGVLVDWPPLESNVQTGDQIEVKGATSIDNHVLSIVTASVHVLGKGSRPRPEVTSAASLACGHISERVVQIEFSPDEAAIGDATHTALFTTRQQCNQLVVIGRLLRRYSPSSLAGHRLRVRGVPIVSYSPSGAVDQVRLMFEDDADVDVLDPPASDSTGNLSSALPEMRSVQGVKGLSRAEAARGYPVNVEGVVTAPINPRHDGYFLQEGATGICVFASRGSAEALRAGQRVRITGRSEKGGFAPVIRQSSLQILGNASLPRPVRIDPGELFQGWEENIWAEIEGLATAVVSDGMSNQLELFAGPKRLLIWFSEATPVQTLNSLIGSRVLVRGVYSPLYTASGDLAGFRLFTPSTSLLKVIEPPPSEEEFRSIASLSQFDVRGLPRHRFRTSGTVTYRDSMGRIYLQDGGSALQVVGTGGGDPPLNTWATLDGFLSPDSGMPRMEHVRWLSTTRGPMPAVRQALAESLASAELQGRLVTIEAFLEDRHTSGGELQLELISGRTRFTAHMEAPGSSDAFPEIRPGALLRLTGVSAPAAGQHLGGALVPSLWLRNDQDISLVRSAPWWDLRRAVYAASAASLLLVIVLVWVVRLRHNLVVEMARRSSLEEQLLHAQKLESVGRLAGGVAHDFNNYLTVVLGYTSLLLDQFPENGLIRSQLNTIREVGQKTASLTRQLLAFSRKQVMQPVPSDLNEIISNAKSTLLPLIGEHIEIVMSLGAVDHANIDPAQFMQVLVNLAVNARDAMPNGGTLIFETMNMDLGPRDVRPEYGLQPGKYACVTVSDTGEGMDRATRERIFEPFFTTKEAGRGTGLGLAVVFGIVKQSKGHIQVQSKPGFGTRFRIYLPTAERPVPCMQEPQLSSKKQLGSETILVVEDQTAVRQLVSTALQKHGYRVISAPGPMQALSILENTTVSIELLLTDVVMPEMSGRVLAAEASTKRPGIRVLYMSGHSEEILSSQEVAGERIDCLEKPFTADQVAAAVREVLDSVAIP